MPNNMTPALLKLQYNNHEQILSQVGDLRTSNPSLTGEDKTRSNNNLHIDRVQVVESGNEREETAAVEACTQKFSSNQNFNLTDSISALSFVNVDGYAGASGSNLSNSNQSLSQNTTSQLTTSDACLYLGFKQRSDRDSNSTNSIAQTISSNNNISMIDGSIEFQNQTLFHYNPNNITNLSDLNNQESISGAVDCRFSQDTIKNLFGQASNNQTQQATAGVYNYHFEDQTYKIKLDPKSIKSSSELTPKMNSTSNQQQQQLSNSHLNAMASNVMHLDNLNQQYINAASSQQHQQNQQYAQSYNNSNSNSSSTNNISSSQQQLQQASAQDAMHQQAHLHQTHLQQSLPTNQQASIYQHLVSNNAASVNHFYGQSVSATSGYHQSQLQSSGTSQSNQLNLANSQHNHHSLNSATAAACAAAVVSQTLKSVANQQQQQQQQVSYHSNNQVSNNNLASSSANNLMTIASAGSNNPFVAPVSHSMHHHNLASYQQSHHHHHNQHHHHHHHQIHQHAANIIARKYQCKMCPQVFMSKAEMKYHNQNHMREAKPYKCLQCPKAFANSSYLSQHMRIHQGVKPYTCELCARKFTQLSHLQQHKRTHTGDKPYKCNYPNCTKQFSQLSNLQSHSRCHQLDKPYKCNSCYKCFNDEQSLFEHIPRHLESKHLKKNLCIFCGSSYQQERGLVKHFQQYHTDKSPTLVAAAIAAGTTGNTTLIASLVSSSNGCSSNSSISSASSTSVFSNNHGASLALNINNY